MTLNEAELRNIVDALVQYEGILEDRVIDCVDGKGIFSNLDDADRLKIINQTQALRQQLLTTLNKLVTIIKERKPTQIVWASVLCEESTHSSGD